MTELDAADAVDAPAAPLSTAEPEGPGDPSGEPAVVGPASSAPAGGIPAPPDGNSPSRWRRPRRRWLVLGAAVALVGTGLGLGLSLGTGSATSGPRVTVSTTVVAATTGTIKQTVAATGTVEPAEEDGLSFAVSGRVSALDVTAGQTVTAGQILASVAPTALEAQEAADQAALTAAESTLSADEAAGASTAQLASDRAAVVSAQDTLTTAKTALSGANLTSPIAGTVASVDLVVGQEVSGSGSGAAGRGAGTSQPGSSGSSGQVVVVSTGSYVVNCTVDDTEVGQIAAGDQAVITPTGSSTPFYGTVSSVSQIATGSSTVASFPVTVSVTGSPTGLYAGASAGVSIVVKVLSDVVEVPSAAISYTGSHPTVTVVHGTDHVTRRVTTGTTYEGETEITHGLHAGEKVLERQVTFTGGTAPGRGAGRVLSPGSGQKIFGGTGPKPLGAGGNVQNSGGTGGR